MKKTIALLILINTISASSQNFHSDFEKIILVNDSISNNYIERLFAIDSTATNETSLVYKNKLQNIIKGFPPKEKKERKEKKRIKKIYSTIHNTFLKKYSIESYFPDIFKTGYYNCVTATALYSYVFESLEIPYRIKELPTHVLLIVYPETLNIYVETTVPGEYAYLIPSESKIKEAVDELISYKLVTKEEVLKKGYQKFYEDYFYDDKNIKKEALIGVQYYNEGVFYLQKEKMSNAFNSFKKAAIYYESPFIDLFINAFTLQEVFESEYDSKKDISSLIKILSDEKYNDKIKKNDLISILYKITNNNSNKIIKEIITDFKKISNLEFKNTALEFLYEYIARKEASNENSKEAIPASEEVLKINKKNKSAKEIIEHFTFKKVSLSTYSIQDLETFETTCEKYPFIKSNNRYPIALGYLYANISLKNYQNQKKNLGEKFRIKFEKLVENSDIIEDINKILISQLYLTAGNYYYYKDQYKTAYSRYKKGMNYVPNNSELIKKAKWSREEF